MDIRNKENLKELFKKFFDLKQAEQAADNVQKGEQLLGDYPACQPSDELIADIKASIFAAVLHKKAVAFRRTVGGASIAAAAVIVLAVISVRLFEKTGEEYKNLGSKEIAKVVWESDGNADNEPTATLAAEIEEIESEMVTLKLGENNDNYKTISDVEMDLIKIDSSFWKG